MVQPMPYDRGWLPPVAWPALIVGLQYLSALPENGDRDVIGSLMAKLARGASAASATG